MREADAELGLAARVPGAGHVLLEAGGYEELPSVADAR